MFGELHEEDEHRSSKWGLVGVIVGSIALALAATSPMIIAAVEPAPVPRKALSERFGDWVGGLKDKAVATLKNQEAKPPEQPPAVEEMQWPKRIPLVAVTGGAIAVFCGGISFIRREHLRASCAAAVIGLVAIGMHYFILAAPLAIGLVLLGLIIYYVGPF